MLCVKDLLLQLELLVVCLQGCLGLGKRVLLQLPRGSAMFCCAMFLSYISLALKHFLLISF